MKPIVITNYSDPVCVWCWGTEPIFRAMETHYPDLFSIRYVMGGMVRDLSDFNDEENGIGGGDATRSTPSFASTWPNRRPFTICLSPSTSIIYFQNDSTRPSPRISPTKRPRWQRRTRPIISCAASAKRP